TRVPTGKDRAGRSRDAGRFPNLDPHLPVSVIERIREAAHHLDQVVDVASERGPRLTHCGNHAGPQIASRAHTMGLHCGELAIRIAPERGRFTRTPLLEVSEFSGRIS